jgi:microcystin-dependent protein
LWLDTSQTPDELKVYDGAAFVRVDPLGITDTAAALKYLQIADAATTYLALAGGTLTGNLTLTGDPTTTNMASNKGYVDAQIAAIPAATDLTPAGTVIYSARSTAPTGYIKANGAAISRSTFSVLFAAIGTQFGVGDGSTTFNVPDLRGEFIRGWSDGHTTDSGRTLGSDQSSQNKSHNHTVNQWTHNHTGTKSFGSRTEIIGGAASDGVSGTADNFGYKAPIMNNKTSDISLVAQGGTESRPRNVALLACIKT